MLTHIIIFSYWNSRFEKMYCLANKCKGSRLEFSIHCQNSRFSACRGYYENECYTFCIKYVALLMKYLVILYNLDFRD